MTPTDLHALTAAELEAWLGERQGEAMALRGRLEVIEGELRVGYRVLRERMVKKVT